MHTGLIIALIFTPLLPFFIIGIGRVAHDHGQRLDQKLWTTVGNGLAYTGAFLLVLVACVFGFGIGALLLYGVLELSS